MNRHFAHSAVIIEPISTGGNENLTERRISFVIRKNFRIWSVRHLPLMMKKKSLYSNRRWKNVFFSKFLRKLATWLNCRCYNCEGCLSPSNQDICRIPADIRRYGIFRCQAFCDKDYGKPCTFIDEKISNVEVFLLERRWTFFASSFATETWSV